MAVSTPEPTREFSDLINKMISSARYLVNAEGDKTDVVLSLAMWGKILAWLEDLDDRIVVKEWLPRLQAGPELSKALGWDDVSTEWEDDVAV